MITKIMGLVLLAVSSLAHADCMRDLANDPELYYIKDKIALGGVDQQTFDMLANESYPTSDDKKIILKFGSKREECRKKMNSSGNGTLEQLYSSAFNASQSLILDLYSGVITYGQFARKRQDILSNLEAKERGVLVQQQQRRQACANRTSNTDTQAMNYAMMDPFQRATYSMYQAGATIGRTAGQMAGLSDGCD